MPDYPHPYELAFFCYSVAKAKGWSLDQALRLLAWNSVKQHWVDNATGKIGRRRWTKAPIRRATLLLIGAFVK